jgi:hypothetical protein
MAPLDIFMQQFPGTVLAYLIPAAIVAGIISAFRKDAEKWIVGTLRTLIRGTEKSAVATQQSLPLDDAPCCPDCRRQMTKRTSRKNENRGMKFWGCTAFPKCRGTRAIVSRE